MTFSAEIKASVGWDWEDGEVNNNRTDYLQQLPEGSDDGEAEAIWHVEDQTLPDGTTANLDLTALVRQILGDANAVAMASVKALLLINEAQSAGKLIVGGAAVARLVRTLRSRRRSSDRRSQWHAAVVQSGHGLAGQRRPSAPDVVRQRRRCDLFGGHRGDAGRIQLGVGLRAIGTRKQAIWGWGLGE